MDTVIIKVESYDEFSVCVFRLGVCLDSSESKADLLVDPFEEVFLWWFGDQSVNIAKRIFFGTDAIMGWNNDIVLGVTG